MNIQSIRRFFVKTLRRFPHSNSGNVSIITCFALVPIIGLASLAIDFGSALTSKSKLNAAADAAVLTAITTAQTDVIAGQATATAVSDGKAQALKAFKTNAGAVYSLLSADPVIDLIRNGQTFTASASYKGSIRTAFGRMFNAASFPIGGHASSSLTMASFLDFYLLLDVSSSMAIPSTASEINRLASIDPDYRNVYPGGCVVACHFTAYKACQDVYGRTVDCQGYNLSRNGGNSANTPVSYCPQPGTKACIQLREDAVAYAVQQLLLTAQSTQTVTNQFKVGLYPFIAHMQALQALTTNLTTVSSAAAGLTSLLDTGNPNGLGSGGTHFENALPEMNKVISSSAIGDGSSSSSRRPFVFLLTDGAQDNQYQLGNGSWSGSNSATTVDTSNCALLKNRGITLAVLYIPYVPIPNPTTIWGDEDGYANRNIPYIPPSLQTCASPGFFFTASAPSDITNALQAMFAQSLQAARLTQ